MSKKDDVIYGSKLTRKDLEKYVPKDQPIPFVYVYACKIKAEFSQDELFEKLVSIKKLIPDLKDIVNDNTGTPYDSIILGFTRKQWAMDFRFKENEVWVNLSFGGTGKKWGSNYALWQVHQKWLFEEIGAKKICDDMEHVDPADIKLAK